MIKVKKNILFSIKFSIVNHLGKKPKKGGNPPKDIKFIIKKNFTWILLFRLMKSCLK